MSRTMKLLWCWRCKTEVPMRGDDEFKRVTSLRGTELKATCGNDYLGLFFGSTSELLDLKRRTRMPYTILLVHIAGNH